MRFLLRRNDKITDMLCEKSITEISCLYTNDELSIINTYYFAFMALINFSLRLSALEFCNEITAQIAAGIHPIKVICRIKQRIDVSILPLKKKERNGKNIAINVMIVFV